MVSVGRCRSGKVLFWTIGAFERQKVDVVVYWHAIGNHAAMNAVLVPFDGHSLGDYVSVTAFRRHLHQVHVFLHDELFDESVGCVVSYLFEVVWLLFLLHATHFDLICIYRDLAILCPVVHGSPL